MTLTWLDRNNWHHLTLLTAAALLLAGCNQSALPPGPTGTVQGKVTYNGNPVPDGSTVMFLHEETSLPATCEVAADGTYTLSMAGEGEVLAGTYSVSVSPPDSGEISEATDMEAYKAAMEGGGAPEATAPFPEKYYAVETSGLSFEVKEGPNTIDVELKDE
jgi:hypothetical protein